MDVEKVKSRFALLSGLDESEAARWEPVINDACAYVEAHCRVKDPGSGQTARLELLSAAYALELFENSGGEKLTQFTAGDVRLGFENSGSKSKNGGSLWQKLIAESADLLDCGEFVFRVVK